MATYVASVTMREIFPQTAGYAAPIEKSWSIHGDNPHCQSVGLFIEQREDTNYLSLLLRSRSTSPRVGLTERACARGQPTGSGRAWRVHGRRRSVESSLSELRAPLDIVGGKRQRLGTATGEDLVMALARAGANLVALRKMGPITRVLAVIALIEVLSRERPNPGASSTDVPWQMGDERNWPSARTDASTVLTTRRRVDAPRSYQSRRPTQARTEHRPLHVSPLIVHPPIES